MAECPLELQVMEESVRDFASHYAQLSVRGKQTFGRLLVLLPSQLNAQPVSRIAQFSPALLFSICGVLQHGRADNVTEPDNTPILPSVLSKLRDWRLLDPNYRYSARGVQTLALALTGIIDESLTRSSIMYPAYGRLRMRWIRSESDQRAPSMSPSPTHPQPGHLAHAHPCAHVLLDMDPRPCDAGFAPCQVVPDSEDNSAILPRRRHAVSGFRSGCSACRHPRMSSSALDVPPHVSKSEPRTPFSDVLQFDTPTTVRASSPRHPKPVARITTKKTRRNPTSSQSLARGTPVDENEPPLFTLPGVRLGIGITFPRQHTHAPRTSNASLSQPVATTASARPYREPGSLPNRTTREGHGQTYSHRVASVDLLLPIAHHSHPRTGASPIDLQSHTLNRAQSLSYTPGACGFGSTAEKVPKRSSNAHDGSSTRLPSWGQTHRRASATVTRSTGATTRILHPVGLSLPPPRARSQNYHPSTPSRPRIHTDVTPRDHRSSSSRTHKYTRSAG